MHFIDMVKKIEKSESLNYHSKTGVRRHISVRLIGSCFNTPTLFGQHCYYELLGTGPVLYIGGSELCDSQALQ